MTDVTAPPGFVLSRAWWESAPLPKTVDHVLFALGVFNAPAAVQQLAIRRFRAEDRWRYVPADIRASLMTDEERNAASRVHEARRHLAVAVTPAARARARRRLAEAQERLRLLAS